MEHKFKFPSNILNDQPKMRNLLKSLSSQKLKVNISDFMSSWLKRNPTLTNKQDCVEVIEGKMTNELLLEVLYAAKLSLIAYAMPFHISFISTQLHVKNVNFLQAFSDLNTDPTFQQQVFSHMDHVVNGTISSIELPTTNQIAGFYIRTPIRIYDNNHNRVYKIPKWDNRESLLNYFVVGNVNVYVLRKNLPNDEYELNVLFRGTSNEFNGIPQYGKNLKNTQLFHIPDFNLETQTFYKQGSETVPLFYFYYCNMILDVKEYIYLALEQLGINKAKRVLVVGHSMGGALTMIFAYLAKFEKPQWWNKFELRMFATPLCCNDAAIHLLEQWVVEEETKYKCVEVINYDDISNFQYFFSGHNGLQKALESGTSAALVWLLENIKTSSQDSDYIENALRIIQLYPDLIIGMFVNGAAKSQHGEIVSDKKVGFRLGHRKEERKLFGTSELHRKYKNTLNVVYCARRYKETEEYLGKSHTNYGDLSMNLLWTPLREYENSLYAYYANHDIKKRNKLKVLPMFNKNNLEKAQDLVKDYKSLKSWEPCKDLMKQYFHVSNSVSN